MPRLAGVYDKWFFSNSNLTKVVTVLNIENNRFTYSMIVFPLSLSSQVIAKASIA